MDRDFAISVFKKRPQANYIAFCGSVTCVIGKWEGELSRAEYDDPKYVKRLARSDKKRDKSSTTRSGAGVWHRGAAGRRARECTWDPSR